MATYEGVDYSSPKSRKLSQNSSLPCSNSCSVVLFSSWQNLYKGVICQVHVMHLFVPSTMAREKTEPDGHTALLEKCRNKIGQVGGNLPATDHHPYYHSSDLLYTRSLMDDLRRFHSPVRKARNTFSAKHFTASLSQIFGHSFKRDFILAAHFIYDF